MYQNIKTHFNKAYADQEKLAKLQRRGFGTPSMAAQLETIAANTLQSLQDLNAQCNEELDLQTDAHTSLLQETQSLKDKLAGLKQIIANRQQPPPQGAQCNKVNRTTRTTPMDSHK